MAEYRAQITGLVAESQLSQLPARRREQARTEVEALSAAVLGAAEALVRWWLRTQAVTASQAAELLIATVAPGLRRRAGRPRGTTTDQRSKEDRDGLR